MQIQWDRHPFTLQDISNWMHMCTRDISSSRLSDSTMQAVFSQPQQIVAKLHRYIVFLWDAIYKQTSFP